MKNIAHPLASAASTAGPCPTICKSSKTPRHWKLPRNCGLIWKHNYRHNLVENLGSFVLCCWGFTGLSRLRSCRAGQLPIDTVPGQAYGCILSFHSLEHHSRENGWCVSGGGLTGVRVEFRFGIHSTVPHWSVNRLICYTSTLFQNVIKEELFLTAWKRYYSGISH